MGGEGGGEGWGVWGGCGAHALEVECAIGAVFQALRVVLTHILRTKPRLLPRPIHQRPHTSIPPIEEPHTQQHQYRQHIHTEQHMTHFILRRSLLVQVLSDCGLGVDDILLEVLVSLFLGFGFVEARGLLDYLLLIWLLLDVLGWVI